jgi:enoyl-CoA hydratase/carnithine racemase
MIGEEIRCGRQEFGETRRVEPRISISIVEGVADVRLNRVDKMNALDQQMFEAIADCGAQLAVTPGLRVVVLSGAGRAFCAGLDRSEFDRMTSGDSIVANDLIRRTHGVANLPQHAAMLWRELPVPVIAAVHGVAFGGGFQVMLGADIRIVAPDTTLSIMETKWGLVPDMAGIALMRLFARDDVIRELTYTARQFSGVEAVGFGFATRTAVDPLVEALALAQEIAGRSPDAIRSAKRLLNTNGGGELAEILLAESREQGPLIGSPNQIEAVRANLEKRAPNFIDP